MKVVRERARLVHAQVRDDTFGERHRPGRGRAQAVEELLAGTALGKIETEPFDRTRRCLVTELSLLSFDQTRMVNLDPSKG